MFPPSESSTLSGHRGSTCLHLNLLPQPAVDTQHHMLWLVPLPSSMCIQATWLRTDMINPFGVCNCDGASNCNRTAAKFSTNLVQSHANSNIKMSCANLKSSNVLPPPRKSNPKCSISSRQFPTRNRRAGASELQHATRKNPPSWHGNHIFSTR